MQSTSLFSLNQRAKQDDSTTLVSYGDYIRVDNSIEEYLFERNQDGIKELYFFSDAFSEEIRVEVVGLSNYTVEEATKELVGVKNPLKKSNLVIITPS